MGVSFNPAKDIPSLRKKSILITGANTGIGKQTAVFLSQHSPAQLWIGARNKQTGQATVDEIQSLAPDTSVRFLELDLMSFASIKSAAKRVLAESERLDILILNAGIMGGHPGTTQDSYEKQFGTNHVGHAFLLKLLTPLLLKAASDPIGVEPRVVSLSSSGHRSAFPPAGGIVFPTLKTAQLGIAGISKYGQSKLANVVYAREFAKRYPQITMVSIHPGEVKTGLFKTASNGGGFVEKVLNMIVVPLVGGTVEEGSKNSCWAATAQGVQSGRYYEPIGVLGKGSKLSKDEELGRKLWEWTEKELKGHEV